MKEIILSLFFISILSSISFAHCLLCVGATGAVVATARFYGINDMITGLFVGVFIVSTSLWFHIILKKRHNGKNYIPMQSLAIIISGIATILIAFYFTGDLVGTSVLGMSTIVVGTAIGSAVSSLSFLINDLMRSINENKNYVPFQPIVLLFAASFLSVLAMYAGGVI